MEQTDIDRGTEIARQALAFALLTRDDVANVQIGRLRSALHLIFGEAVNVRLQEWLAAGNAMVPLPPNA